MAPPIPTTRDQGARETDYIGPRGRVRSMRCTRSRTGRGFVNVLFVQWQTNGERVVIWPKEVATGKMIIRPGCRRNDGQLALVKILVYGAVISAIYAMLAVGFTLIFGVARILNLAHGSFYALGAYRGLRPHGGCSHLPLLARAPCWRCCSWRFRRRDGADAGAAAAPLLRSRCCMITLAVALMVEQVLLLVFGSEARNVPSMVSGTCISPASISAASGCWRCSGSVADPGRPMALHAAYAARLGDPRDLAGCRGRAIYGHPLRPHLFDRDGAIGRDRGRGGRARGALPDGASRAWACCR